MKLIRNLSQLRSYPQACVATIGNFDGVHLGHQAILQQLSVKAKILQVPMVVIIFEPQPQEFWRANTAPTRLSRLREKITTLHQYGVEQVLCLRFNAQLAALSATDFIQDVLVEGLGVRHLVVGDDFCFGKGRQGNFSTLQKAGEQYGFTIESQHTFILEEQRVSSTRVRYALRQGNLTCVAKLLGRPYTLWGRISAGAQRGRTIGFPTANIFLHRKVSPLQGVFAVKMHGITEKPLPAIANLGKRPTVDGHTLLLEVHIFDFNQNIYGRYVEIEFVHKIRDEQHFMSFEALKRQIEKDVKVARSRFFTSKLKAEVICHDLTQDSTN
ncbi:MAG: bifunctional riboflavin kinase/FAD synthetase [Thiomargarita sp.]|nr:bifunctional riboflavin kinase/FAD synthetase [Thiomargarita sp.]